MKKSEALKKKSFHKRNTILYLDKLYLLYIGKCIGFFFFLFSFFFPSKSSLTSKPRLTGSFFEFSSGCIKLHHRRRYWRLSGINDKEKQSSKQIFTCKPSLPFFKPSPTSQVTGNNRSALSRPQESPRDVSLPLYTFDCISHRILPQSELPGVANAQN